jgi:hypothetical protein
MNVRDAERRMAEIAREDAAIDGLLAFARDVISWADATGVPFPERLYQRAAAIVAAHAHAGTAPATGRAEPGAQHAGRGRALPLPAPIPAA